MFLDKLPSLRTHSSTVSTYLYCISAPTTTLLFISFFQSEFALRLTLHSFFRYRVLQVLFRFQPTSSTQPKRIFLVRRSTITYFHSIIMASTTGTSKRKANEISHAHAEQNGIGVNNGGIQTPPIASASSSNHGTPGTLNTHASEGKIQTTRHPITTDYIMPPTTTLASLSHPYPS